MKGHMSNKCAQTPSHKQVDKATCAAHHRRVYTCASQPKSKSRRPEETKHNEGQSGRRAVADGETALSGRNDRPNAHAMSAWSRVYEAARHTTPIMMPKMGHLGGRLPRESVIPYYANPADIV